jgi:hypothetical protein
MANEAYDNFQFYRLGTSSILYLLLRYALVGAVYMLFAEEWKSIS